MADILQFRPRPALAGLVDVRAEIEEAAQFALDTADRLIALLDEMDTSGDSEDEPARFALRREPITGP